MHENDATPHEAENKAEANNFTFVSVALVRLAKAVG